MTWPRSSGLGLVAEGVEDESTARILADLDGVIAQGWLYARPMPAQQIVRWLEDRAGRHRPGARSTAREAGVDSAVATS
jgi:sensor c-di-GMP phosphodiesterase-like protein